MLTSITDVVFSVIVIAVVLFFVISRKRLAAVAAEISRTTGGQPWSERRVQFSSIFMLVLGVVIIGVIIASLLLDL